MSLSRKTSVFRPKGATETKDEVGPSTTEALPSDIFEQRLYAWKATIKQLVIYFQGVAEVEQQSARGYTKVFNSLQVPLKEGHHLLPVGSNGVQDVVVAVNNTSQQLFEHHTEFARCITDQIVGNLNRLKADIKTRLLSSKKELVNHESNLGRERQNSAKIISDYDQACHNTDNNVPLNGKAAPTDPWIVHNTLQKQLQKQIFEENSFHKTMISTQKSLEIFETSIVETLKNTLDSYYKWRTTYSSKLLEQINVATGAVTALTPELEWNSFYEKNQPPLIDPASSEITMEAINYPNKDNQLTTVKKYGVMERQGSMFKSARRDHCFLTPSGFLHGYTQSDPIVGSPEYSIYLPSSVLRGYSESNLAFEIAEKGTGGLFHRSEHSYVFKFLTKEDLAGWWNCIKEFTKTTEETPFNSGSQALAPSTAAAVDTANTEPIAQEPRAVVDEPSNATQQPVPTTVAGQAQEAPANVEETQQPISAALQQSQYPTTTPQQLRKAKSFVQSMNIELERDPTLYSEGNKIKWNRPSSGQETDGFEIKRRGDADVRAKIELILCNPTEEYKLSKALAHLLGFDTGTQGAFNSLQDPQEKHFVNSDENLRNVSWSVDQPEFKPNQAYDIQVDAPYEYRTRLESMLSNSDAKKEIAALDEKIVQYVHALHNATIKRGFFYRFFSKPTKLLESWISSQTKDLETILGDSYSLDLDGPRKASLFGQPWVDEAVFHYLSSKSQHQPMESMRPSGF
ncbi:hypothetical protein K493DRAFT_406827 [Basidiobolus meristosporus CBS 931.73]|uniref:PH domain-containing protein n=1 Tax=Basidiobolus meristosporus CBS 931.73 TaxID=1314790 RepID=A0A1Y1YJD3_9FUNG|nr:hypothetical protein K493DRAFT_406827 [Basidiobolus meristosporus CBS 931.73]|eukprot:ORX97704.1 hypothetical protein K493DRAFT_406827 [Basidiobolus meristosporus CBS 931.73]